MSSATQSTFRVYHYFPEYETVVKQAAYSTSTARSVRIYTHSVCSDSDEACFYIAVLQEDEITAVLPLFGPQVPRNRT